MIDPILIGYAYIRVQLFYSISVCLSYPYSACFTYYTLSVGFITSDLNSIQVVYI